MKKYSKVIFSHIPGFRSNEKVNKVVASIYYLIVIGYLLLSFIVGNIQADQVKFVISALLFPFIVFGMMDYMSKK